MSKTRIILMIVIFAIIITAVAMMVNLNGNSFDFTDRDIRLIVTDSMDGEPHDEYDISTIEKDSIVMVRKIHDDSGKQQLMEGDVIQFYYYGLMNHHRVVSNDAEKRVIITKGDNSPVSESVPYEDVQGIVIGKNHPLGVITSFVKSYWVTVIAFILAGFVAANAIHMYRKGEEKV